MTDGDEDRQGILQPVQLFFERFMPGPLEACLEILILPFLTWSGGVVAVIRTPEELAALRDMHCAKAAQAGYSRTVIEELQLVDHGPSTAIVRVKSTREDAAGRVSGRVESFMMLRKRADEWCIFVSVSR